MTQPGLTTPYSSVAPLFGAVPSWVPSLEAERIQSYNAYDDIYWNNNDSFRILMRGGDAEEDVIYVPTPRTIIETLNRYVGARMGFVCDEATGSPASRELARLTFTNLFRRERFFSNYNANKRFGLIRGDWLWHITANPLKPEGTRLSILPVHPASYFPVYESDRIPGGDPDKIVAVHLVDQIMEGEDVAVRRQTYEKFVDESTGAVTISSELSVFKMDEWFDAAKSPIRVITPLTTLPPEITAIPVYHIKNGTEPNNPYGSSELRGFERVLAAVNQAFTDEDITLALEGLGVYATDSAARPIDKDTGEATDWSVYPGRVVQNAAGFRRVPGVGSVVPYGDHIDRMVRALKEASGANDAAIGQVDVAVAESGVALLLHLAPALAKAEEQDQVIRDVHAQLFHDLRAWLDVYEGVNVLDVDVLPTFGDKLPRNHKQNVELVVAMMATVPPILSAASARRWLATQGLEEMFDPNEEALVAAEQDAAAARADLLGARAASELEGAPDADSGALDGGEA